MNSSLKIDHWDDPEGWDGEGGGRGVQDGNTCKSMSDSCQCMAKITTILIKILIKIRLIKIHEKINK